MKYQEKANLVDKAISMLRDDYSREEIEDFLRKEGLKTWDIASVNQSIDNRLKKVYKSQIKHYMQEGSLESKLSEFDEIDADLFEKIQYEIISEFKNESTEKVKSMVIALKSEEEILSSVTSPFFDEEEVFAAIDQVQNKVEEKRNYLNKGIVFLLGGILLTYFTMDFVNSKILIFAGLLTLGIRYLYLSNRKI